MEKISRAEAVANDAIEKARNNEFGGEKTGFGKEIGRLLLEEEISSAEELAIIRKAIFKLLTNNNLINSSDFAEFVNYNNKVEEIKTKVREEEEKLNGLQR